MLTHAWGREQTGTTWPGWVWVPLALSSSPGFSHDALLSPLVNSPCGLSLPKVAGSPGGASRRLADSLRLVFTTWLTRSPLYHINPWSIPCIGKPPKDEPPAAQACLNRSWSKSGGGPGI